MSYRDRNRLLLVCSGGLMVLAVIFGPPSGFVGERAVLTASSVLMLEFEGDCSGNQTGHLEVAYAGGRTETFEEPYFDGRSCRYRFVLLPGKVTGFTLTMRTGRGRPTFGVVRLIDQNNSVISEWGLAETAGPEWRRWEAKGMVSIEVPEYRPAGPVWGWLWDAGYVLGLSGLVAAGLLAGLRKSA